MFTCGGRIFEKKKKGGKREKGKREGKGRRRKRRGRGQMTGRQAMHPRVDASVNQALKPSPCSVRACMCAADKRGKEGEMPQRGEEMEGL